MDKKRKEVIETVSVEGHCPSGSFVNINASSVIGVHGLCPVCPTFPPHDKTGWTITTKGESPEYKKGQVIPLTGTVDETVRHGIHLSSEEQDRLLMCSIDKVPLKLKEHISPDENVMGQDGKIRRASWEDKQREINPRAKLFQILSGSPSPGQLPGVPSPPDEEDNFKKCILAHFKGKDDEEKLMKEIITYNKGDLQCIHHLKGANCDNGYSDVFTSLPHEILKHNQTEVTSMTRDDYDLSVRNMLIQSRDTEELKCKGEVSDTTQSLLKTPEYKIDLKIPDMSGIWFAKRRGIFAFTQKIINLLVILVAVYIIGNFILQLFGR